MGSVSLLEEDFSSLLSYNRLFSFPAERAFDCIYALASSTDPWHLRTPFSAAYLFMLAEIVLQIHHDFDMEHKPTHGQALRMIITRLHAWRASCRGTRDHVHFASHLASYLNFEFSPKINYTERIPTPPHPEAAATEDKENISPNPSQVPALIVPTWTLLHNHSINSRPSPRRPCPACNPRQPLKTIHYAPPGRTIELGSPLAEPAGKGKGKKRSPLRTVTNMGLVIR
jgi:hypothetical protein